jgi:Protein of unknown function (DUF3551)
MQRVVLALLSVSGLGIAAIVPAQAVGTAYPFCIQGDQYPGLSNCTFTSYEQCQATASGTNNSCMANPYYNPGGKPWAISHTFRLSLLMLVGRDAPDRTTSRLR